VTIVADPRRAALVELAPVRVDGVAGQRLMVVLRAPGCSYGRRTGGCSNCGFFLQLTTNGAPVADEDLVAQLATVFDARRAELPRVLELDLYCSGSFFNPDEIPAAARPGLLALCAEAPAVRVVLVESRPEFVTDEALAAARGALGRGSGPRLAVAVGLESADDEIRLRRIRKGFSLESFERAAAAIARAGAELVVYLLLKPIGTGEEEAVADVLASGEYLIALASRLGVGSPAPGRRASWLRVALEPVFVPDGTPLAAELRAGRYSPPSLWSALRAARDLSARGLAVHVGLSPEGMAQGGVPQGCAECTAPLRAALASFNATQDTRDLELRACPRCGAEV